MPNNKDNNKQDDLSVEELEKNFITILNRMISVKLMYCHHEEACLSGF